MSENFAKTRWFTAPAVQSLFAALGADDTRLVGGCVRDALLGLPVQDIDAACTHPPEKVEQLLKKAKIASLPSGIEHGTITAQFETQNIEITSLRQDVKTDGRHAKVVFGGTWDTDAQRRDFTINALYCDSTGAVHDPLGQGLADIQAQRLAFIGDAEKRIKEDYLRVLRYFRMSAIVPNGKTESSVIALCTKYAPKLASLSGERVRSEMTKLLCLPSFAPALQAMQKAKVLAPIFPKSFKPAIARAQSVAEVEESQFFPPNARLRFAGLCADTAAAESLGAHWRFSKADANYMSEALAPHEPLVCYLSIREVRRLLYLWGQELFRARVLLAWAGDNKPKNAIQWRALLAMAESWTRPKLPLTGRMMQMAGVPKGPEMSRVQKEVERWWIDSDFTDDEFSLIERLKAIVQATIY